MAHWRSLGPDPRYLAAYQLNDKEVTVTIESVVREMVTNAKGTGPCRVIRFKGAKLPWICNVTNGLLLESLYGEDPAGWIGKDITIYPTHIPDKVKGAPPIFTTRLKPPPPKKTTTVQSDKSTQNKEVSSDS